MNKIRHLSHDIKVTLPEVESSTAVRFCPKCGKEIPNQRTICEACENPGSQPRRVIFLLCGLILVILVLIWLSRSPFKPAPVPRGTLAPVILLYP